MADRDERELERRAAQGDADAAERLYWSVMRSRAGAQLLDRLIESVVALQIKAQPTVMQKLAFLRGEPVERVTEVDLERLARRNSEIRSSEDLHRIPRSVRRPGFVTYCHGDGSVYRYESNGEWRRLVRLSAEPPGYPLHIVATLRDRDDLDGVGNGESCLVLANMGLYKSFIERNRYSNSEVVKWHSVRFEKGA